MCGSMSGSLTGPGGGPGFGFPPRPLSGMATGRQPEARLPAMTPLKEDIQASVQRSIMRL